MAATPTESSATAHSNGGGALAETVLSSPERGQGYFYPATAPGAALGLFGFGFGLLLLASIEAEWVRLTAIGIVIPVAFGLSALCELVGGLWDFRAGNMFGGLWQVAFAGFWLSLGLILNTYAPNIIKVAGPSGFTDAFAAYLFIWAAVTCYMTVAAYFVARPAFIAFLLLVAVFFILGLANLAAPGNTADTLRQIGGYVGIVDALVALYVSAVLVINTTSGRNLLPLWPYPYRS